MSVGEKVMELQIFKLDKVHLLIKWISRLMEAAQQAANTTLTYKVVKVNVLAGFIYTS